MKVLIIYHSEHHGNTEKIAKAISSALDAKLIKSQNIDIDNVDQYDLIGFGSGIYYGSFHQNIHSFIDALPEQSGKKSFVFSTTGSKAYSTRAHEAFKSKLKEKGFKVIGEFSCLGFDTALSSEGINKGRPNADDLKAAKEFAEGLKNK
jgi:flavodoxin